MTFWHWIIWSAWHVHHIVFSSAGAEWNIRVPREFLSFFFLVLFFFFWWTGLAKCATVFQIQPSRAHVIPTGLRQVHKRSNRSSSFGLAALHQPMSYSSHWYALPCGLWDARASLQSRGLLRVWFRFQERVVVVVVVVVVVGGGGSSLSPTQPHKSRADTQMSSSASLSQPSLLPRQSLLSRSCSLA